MPTYEYECKKCGHTFEAFQSMSDAPLKNCPQCGKEVRRLIHGGTGVIFKGSGFYVTDKGKGASAAGAAKSAKPAESAAAGASAAGPENRSVPAAGAAAESAAKGAAPAADAKPTTAKTA